MEHINDTELFELWLGTFEGENFVWKTIKEFEEFSTAYKYFKDFVKQQIAYTDEELLKTWGCTRLDIELRQGKTRIEWVGIYSKSTDMDEEKRAKLKLKEE